MAQVRYLRVELTLRPSASVTVMRTLKRPFGARAGHGGGVADAAHDLRALAVHGHLDLLVGALLRLLSA